MNPGDMDLFQQILQMQPPKIFLPQPAQTQPPQMQMLPNPMTTPQMFAPHVDINALLLRIQQLETENKTLRTKLSQYELLFQQQPATAAQSSASASTAAVADDEEEEEERPKKRKRTTKAAAADEAPSTGLSAQEIERQVKHAKKRIGVTIREKISKFHNDFNKQKTCSTEESISQEAFLELMKGTKAKPVEQKKNAKTIRYTFDTQSDFEEIFGKTYKSFRYGAMATVVFPVEIIFSKDSKVMKVKAKWVIQK